MLGSDNGRWSDRLGIPLVASGGLEVTAEVVAAGAEAGPAAVVAGATAGVGILVPELSSEGFPACGCVLSGAREVVEGWTGKVVSAATASCRERVAGN